MLGDAAPRGDGCVQSRVPLGTFRLKFLLALSSLPMSSSKPVTDRLLYGRSGRMGVGSVVRGNFVTVEVRRAVNRKSAGRAKWGGNSRMSKVTQFTDKSEQARVHKSYLSYISPCVGAHG